MFCNVFFIISSRALNPETSHLAVLAAQRPAAPQGLTLPIWRCDSPSLSPSLRFLQPLQKMSSLSVLALADSLLVSVHSYDSGGAVWDAADDSTLGTSGPPTCCGGWKINGLYNEKQLRQGERVPFY